MPTLFLGVDGGQSRTKALIGDEAGCVLGAGAAGPCNHVGAAEGRVKFTRTVRECVAIACESAGLDPARSHFRAACFGMSGGPEDKRELLSEILSTERLVVTHDGLIALSGAMAGGPGIVTIAGTGSFAFGRNAEGRTARAGGWGYIFGDEGGGFDIARQALRAALRFEEGWGPPTALRESLIAGTNARDANDALHRLYTVEWPRSRVATLAKLVDAAAQAGDAVAIAILHTAALQLADLAAAVAVQLQEDALNVAYIGGVFRSATLLDRYRSVIEQQGFLCATPAFGPAAGALLEAYHAANLDVRLSGDLLRSEF